MFPGRSQFGKIVLVVEHASGGLGPVVHESGLHLSDRRAFEAKLRVAPMLRRVSVALPDIGQSCSADKANFPIDDEQLAMIAVIEPGQIEPDERVIFFDLDAGFEVEKYNRSEEHTSELQSHHDLVCRLLLEKKKKKTT